MTEGPLEAVNGGDPALKQISQALEEKAEQKVRRGPNSRTAETVSEAVIKGVVGRVNSFSNVSAMSHSSLERSAGERGEVQDTLKTVSRSMPVRRAVSEAGRSALTVLRKEVGAEGDLR